MMVNAAVAPKDRISVDLTDIKERIENCRSHPAWRELSLAGKVRSLIIEKLEEIERGPKGDKEELH